VVAVTYFVYGVLDVPSSSAVLYQNQHISATRGKVAIAAVPATAPVRVAAIRVAGLGQITLGRQQPLIAAGIALAAIAVAAAAIGWFIAGLVLRPLRTSTAAAHLPS
jgi:hypothetical protein